MDLDLDATELLTTTRSVRKRLDLTRPVEREVVLECLDIALQAPTGSNNQGWQWVFVTDQEKKQAIADIYGRHFDPYVSARGATYAEGDTRAARQDAVRDSATYLRQHFHEVPVMMIPCHAGRVDGAQAAQQAGFWGSLFPAAWSMMLALRAKGLGSAWTSLHLRSEREVADLLGIPYDGYTQGGLFPIAYTLGTDFKPAPRVPAADLAHWDAW